MIGTLKVCIIQFIDHAEDTDDCSPPSVCAYRITQYIFGLDIKCVIDVFVEPYILLRVRAMDDVSRRHTITGKAHMRTMSIPFLIMKHYQLIRFLVYHVYK